MSNFRIKTPHAAVLIWNYSDRIGAPEGKYNATGVKKLNEVEKGSPPLIISTLSCVSIHTHKSKSDPVGQFNLILAPYKNWVSTITAGSWCAILMSNKSIEKKDLERANPKHVKMLGRIETVRCETSVDESGKRKTLYYVSGTDWGNIFTSMLYIDNLINSNENDKNQGNPAAVAIRNALFGERGSPKSMTVKENLSVLLKVMGKNLGGFSKVQDDIGRLAKTIYEFTIPSELANYFSFKNPQDQRKPAQSINKVLTLRTGWLVGKHKYSESSEAVGFIDPFSLQGTNTLWQILLENSNPTLNEMFCEMDWKDDGGVQLVLYNRIRPFSYKGFKSSSIRPGGIKSYFQLVRHHDIDPVTVISVNAGTNWRDKFNFVEIKPNFSDFNVIATLTKQKTQMFDEESFKREGFRPLIFATKQFPIKPNDRSLNIDWQQMTYWVSLLREWYFNNHRMLNGTITMVGASDYIAVGDNIKFPADLLNPTPNINLASMKSMRNHYILAHVESVSHSFTVNPDGAREYITTITFVRGIVVNEANELVGDGMLDQFTSPGAGLSDQQDRNTSNVVSTSDPSDPDPQKVRGM